MLTFCAYAGIDTCPMEGFDKKVADEALNLKDLNLESVLLMPIGYRAEDDFFSSLEKVRKPIEDSVIFY